jgi:hypothetical protein
LTAVDPVQLRTFRLWRDGVAHALEGGLWLHPFLLRGERWAHLVSADRERLLTAGRVLSMRPDWLQYRPLRHPATWERHPAWHWDLRGERLRRALGLASDERRPLDSGREQAAESARVPRPSDPSRFRSSS